MGRSKVTSKVVKSTVGNQDVIGMFQDMLGMGEGPSGNVKIIYPKYEKLKTAIRRYVKLFDLLSIANAVKRNKNILEYTLKYVSDLKLVTETMFQVRDLTKMEQIDPSTLPKDDQVMILNNYKQIKDSKLVESIILTCKNLIRYRKYLEKQGELSDKFILKMPGLQYSPIYGATGINFKILYSDITLKPEDKSYLLTILHKLYTISHEIYEILTSPDIDIEEFVTIIMSSVDDVRKQIPRCDDAFNKILESVDLLRHNFGDYYKDFVSSNNSSVIMENFIIDVSENTNPSPKLTAQFRKIISHYRKIASQQNNNPKLKMLFSHIDKNFQELDKLSRGKTEEVSDIEEISDEEGDEEVPDLVKQDVIESTEEVEEKPDVELEEIPLDDDVDDKDTNIIVPVYARSPEIVSIKEPDSPTNNNSIGSDYDCLSDAPGLDELK
jgi:hypothetical protein